MADAQWTDVIEVIVQPDEENGGYDVGVYDAKERELQWPKNVPLWAVGERGTMLEVSSALSELGYEGVSRWKADGSEDSGAMVRSYRRKRDE